MKLAVALSLMLLLAWADDLDDSNPGHLIGDSQNDLIDDESYDADFEMQDLEDELTKNSPVELQIYHFTVDAEIEEQIWCGDNYENLLILTEDKTVYRSSD